MLYMTTRDDHDAFTSHKALLENSAPDGGLYIPYKLPMFSKEQISSFINLSFAETVAKMLNLFFSAQLNSWDIDFCLGRNPLKLGYPGRKSVVLETWHNPGRSYAYAANSLNTLLIKDKKGQVSSWTGVAITIAFMFGAYVELCKENILQPHDSFDICVRAGDFTEPAAALYCKQMGLPIQKIIICTKENSAVWDLVNHGQFGTALLHPKQKLGMERLIRSIFDSTEVAHYKAACERHGVYTLSEENNLVLAEHIFAAVIGSERSNNFAGNVFNACGYPLDPDAAICYAGVQDYRAKTGQGSLAVLFGHIAQSDS
ncbi:MAG: hypothetical protein IJB02_01135 [Oscillospiraceae bacterium]|nr:hypothetical protein [Oscillospiraceae bacterium]